MSPSPNPDGTGVRGRDAAAEFYDAIIGPNQLTVTCGETFSSTSPTAPRSSWSTAATPRRLVRPSSGFGTAQSGSRDHSPKPPTRESSHAVVQSTGILRETGHTTGIRHRVQSPRKPNFLLDF